MKAETEGRTWATHANAYAYAHAMLLARCGCFRPVNQDDEENSVLLSSPGLSLSLSLSPLFSYKSVILVYVCEEEHPIKAVKF